MKFLAFFTVLIFTVRVFAQGQSFSTAFWKKGGLTAPTDLILTHTSNNRNFTISWTGGVGVGNCRVQFKRVATWTNVGTVMDCSSDVSNHALVLPTTTNWTDESFNATGVEVRIVNASTLAAIASFPERLTCIPISGSVTSTPDVDEDCNKNWNNTATGSLDGCPSGETCRKATAYMSSNSCGGVPGLTNSLCTASTIPDGCNYVSASRSMFLEPGTGCSTPGQNLYY